MNLVKESQFSYEGTDILLPEDKVQKDVNNLSGPDYLGEVKDLLADFSVEEGDFEPEDMIEEEDEDESSEVEIEEHEHNPVLVLTLDKIPGGADQDDLVEPVVEVEEEVEVDEDPWEWGKPAKFLPWLSKMMTGIPKHSGKDTAGLERAISYLETLDREISKAVRMDLNNEIAIDALEQARDEIQRGLERLEERLDKVNSFKYSRKAKKGKKKADSEDQGLIKEAQRATMINGITVTVPLLISSIARICVNGLVSAGHDIEDSLVKLASKYKLTDREKLELVQLISDMGFPVRRDRGLMLDEEVVPGKGFDWNQNFPG